MLSVFEVRCTKPRNTFKLNLLSMHPRKSKELVLDWSGDPLSTIDIKAQDIGTVNNRSNQWEIL